LGLKHFYFLVFVFTFYACGSVKNLTIDPLANMETKILFHNLQTISKNHILFGHQHATEYGHGWSGDPDRSDVKSVVGSHPAVIGVDFSGFSGRSQRSIDAFKEKLRENIRATYDRGGVVTIAWHFNNPVGGRGYQWTFTDSITVVDKIIPGGSHHETYKNILTDIGLWLQTVKGSDGKLIPMIFRPFHEFDGSWFWWGKPQTSKDDFIALWRFTVSHLRDTMGIHHLLYAYSPDNKFSNEDQFAERYPGDKWVDMVGMDNYGDMGRNRYAVDTAAAKLKIVSGFALKRNKLAAFTETGLESIPNTTWWTETLLKTLRKEKINLCYVLVWRNDQRSETHYYAPFPGQVSVPDFIKFYEDDYTLFEKDLKQIYFKKM